jgi:hypothetical protein
MCDTPTAVVQHVAVRDCYDPLGTSVCVCVCVCVCVSAGGLSIRGAQPESNRDATVVPSSRVLNMPLRQLLLASTTCDEISHATSWNLGLIESLDKGSGCNANDNHFPS